METLYFQLNFAVNLKLPYKIEESKTSEGNGSKTGTIQARYDKGLTNS